MTLKDKVAIAAASTTGFTAKNLPRSQASLAAEACIDVINKSGYTIQMTATPYAGAPITCNGLGAGLAGQGYKSAADPGGAWVGGGKLRGQAF